MTEEDLPGASEDAPHRGAHGQLHQRVSPRLSDVEAYRLLVRLGHTAQHLAPRCWSTAAATALAAAAHTLRTLASALYRANIHDDPTRGK